jgi:hypothetical protein
VFQNMPPSPDKPSPRPAHADRPSTIGEMIKRFRAPIVSDAPPHVESAAFWWTDASRENVLTASVDHTMPLCTVTEPPVSPHPPIATRWPHTLTKSSAGLEVTNSLRMSSSTVARASGEFDRGRVSVDSLVRGWNGIGGFLESGV